MNISSNNMRRKLTELFLVSPQDNAVVKVLVGIILIVFITLMFPHPESIEYSYNVGTVWTDKDLIAQFSFPVLKDLHDYEKDRQEAVRNVYPVFERQENVVKSQLDSIDEIVQTLKIIVAFRAHRVQTLAAQDSLKYLQSIVKLPFILSENEWAVLNQWYMEKRHSTEDEFKKFRTVLTSTLAEVSRTGIIDQLKIKKSHAEIALRKGAVEEIIPYTKLYDVDEAIEAGKTRSIALLGEGPQLTLASKILSWVVRPNILFNHTQTDIAISSAEENVPRTVGFVQQNERIISKHERITEEKKLKIDSYRKMRVELGSESGEYRHWIGIIIHVMIVLGLFAIYLFLFRKRIFHNNGRLVLISLIVLLEAFLTYLSLLLNVTEPVQYLIFIPAASMLLTIIFDSRVAFYGTVAIALLVGGIRGNDYTFALTSLVAGALGAYTVRDIRNRTQIFRSLVFIFIGYALAIIGLSLEQFDNLSTLGYALTYALANAVFSPVLTYGLLIFFERVFKVTTDLTLLELSDFNQPLLRRLFEEAPGTFHHSMTIGTMVEAAAEAIGANSILTRVGGYYHDIGKMLKPEYFVENQTRVNRHNRLRPRMSALILQSHVKEGVELGRAHGLPEKILDFIPQHHGTTQISFFYDKALKQAARRPGKEVINEQDFQYPGPKPQTRETALVMLADSVEASTRAIDDMTPQKLEHAIENMIKQRFSEGQLDECELTLRDLTKIKEAFLKVLVGIHHQRIQYPEQQREEEIISTPQIPVEEAITVPIIGPAPQILPEQPAISPAVVSDVSPVKSHDLKEVESSPTEQEPPFDGNGQSEPRPQVADGQS